jgi:hypothetical protein
MLFFLLLVLNYLFDIEETGHNIIQNFQRVNLRCLLKFVALNYQFGILSLHR